MNIHGKNNFRMGTIGEHVVEFTALLPTGAEITCSPKKNGDLFYAMIGGLGMLGVFTSITLQMKKMHSGLLEVHAWPVPNLEAHLQAICWTGAPQHNYIVGWLDAPPAERGWAADRSMPPITCTRAKTPMRKRPCGSITRPCPTGSLAFSPNPSCTISWRHS